MTSTLQRIARDRLKSDKRSKINLQRKDYLRRLESGKAAIEFAEDIKKYGSNDRKQDLILLKWHAEYARMLADMRIAETLTTGCAQNSKTLMHTLLVCWLSSQAKLNTLWAYAQESTLNRCVPLQFKPVMEEWLRKARIDNSKNTSKNNKTYQVPGAACLFVHVNNPSRASGGGASAGSAVVSVSASIAIKEERSQYQPGADAPINRRLDMGELARHPVRQLGTPGRGKGIEEEIEGADYNFWPHTHCRECGHHIPFNPKGTLLKPMVKTLPTGEEIIKHLSDSGRPVEWFYHDEDRPIKTAYFGCPECGTEIPKEDRLNASFYCVKTGVGLTQFLDELEDSDQRIKAAINLSPLLRDTKYNLAADIIQDGLDTTDSEDWQQQRLGLPSENGGTGIALRDIERAIAAPPPNPAEYGKKIRLAGVDQGRDQYWLIVIDYYLPKDYLSMSAEQITANTVRDVVYDGAENKTNINAILDNLGVEYGLIDNEPTRDAYLEYPLLDMGDEKAKLKHSIKEIVVCDGGVEYPAWELRNDKFFNYLHEAFTILTEDGHPLARLPESWRKHVRIQNERSPVRHLISMTLDPTTGIWVRPDDRVDHQFHSWAFAEAAFHIKVSGFDDNAEWVGLA